MSSISSFDIISVVLCKEWPDRKIFLSISASAADAAWFNPNRIKTLLANGLITFSLMVILLLVMNQKVCREILLIVSSYIFDILTN